MYNIYALNPLVPSPTYMINRLQAPVDAPGMGKALFGFRNLPLERLPDNMSHSQSLAPHSNTSFTSFSNPRVAAAAFICVLVLSSLHSLTYFSL